MNDLFAALDRQIDDAASQVAAARQADALAIAYARSSAANIVIVQAGIAAITALPSNPTPVTSVTFISALAVLPAADFDQEMSALRVSVFANNKLKNMIGWRDYEKRIKRSADSARNARQAESVAATGTPVMVVDPDDFLALAGRFRDHLMVDGFCTVVHFAGSWHRWNGHLYESADQIVVTGVVYEFLAVQQVQAGTGTVALKPNEKLARELLSAFAPLVHVEVTDRIIFWLDAAEQERPRIDRCVFLANGTLATDWWLAGRADALIPPTPALFIQRVLPVTFKPEALAPHWECFVKEIFDGDINRMVALQVLFGYWMLPATWLQVIVYLVGLPGSGKGTLTQVLQQLFGLSCANPSLDGLGDRFGLMGLVGCQLAVMTDVHDVGRNGAGAHERLLKISGEDPVDVERKHLEPLLSVRLPVRFVLVMNELVPLPDVSGALERRTVILPFRTSFVGRVKTGLAASLIATEAGGILNWALEGLRLLHDLREKAEAKEQSTKDAVLAVLRVADAEPEYEMLADLSYDTSSWVSDDELFDQWNHWNDNRYSKSARKTEFISRIIATAKGAAQTGQRTDSSGRRVRAVIGLCLTGHHTLNQMQSPSSTPGATP